MGDLWVPQLNSQYGGYSATLETLYDFFINNVPDPDSALAQNADFDEILRQHPDVHKVATTECRKDVRMVALTVLVEFHWVVGVAFETGEPPRGCD
jgi:hypothetical protein